MTILSRVAIFIALTTASILPSLPLATAQTATQKQAPTPLTTNIDTALTDEQLEIYRVLLASWYEKEMATLNLSQTTAPIDLKESFWDKTCSKDLTLETQDVKQSHTFRSQDLPKLGTHTIRLVDATQQESLIKRNDPSTAIRQGKPVDESVANAFKLGLLTLSEIRFDKSHSHALVAISFYCGGLCGHYTPMLLQRVNGHWTIKSACGGYVS